MPTSVFLKAADFEPVYGWFEQHEDLAVQVWGLEEGQRAALLAYSDGPEDDFGWSNWARAAFDDPSQLAMLFDQLELVADVGVTTRLSAAFPGSLSASAPSAD